MVPATSVQVALRFPGCNDALVVSGAAMKDMVRGTDWHTDGLRQGKKHSFSLLVGVALSENQVKNRGNLCLWKCGQNKFNSFFFVQLHFNFFNVFDDKC